MKYLLHNKILASSRTFTEEKYYLFIPDNIILNYLNMLKGINAIEFSKLFQSIKIVTAI